MADNRTMYGFRWATAHNGRPHPQPERFKVASGENFTVGGSNKDLGPGDLVKLKNDGTVTLCAGTESTAEAPYGVVVAVGPRYDSTIGQAGAMRPTETLPSGVTYSKAQYASTVYVVPVSAGTWEVDVDDSATATDLAAYEAMIGENVDHINTGSGSRPTPKLDISTHATTNTLHWRIVGVSTSMHNQDYSGANVKLLVRSNVSQESWSSATGV